MCKMSTELYPKYTDNEQLCESKSVVTESVTYYDVIDCSATEYGWVMIRRVNPNDGAIGGGG